jgi:hypothetical protein
MQYIYVAYLPILFHKSYAFSVTSHHQSSPLHFVGSTRISARTCAHPSPLKHADERRRYVPIARAISKFCHGEGATLVRIARRDRIHSRRVEPAPRGPPATSVGFRLIDELRAHQWGPPGPVPARCTRTRSCVRPARCTRTSSECIRASRPSARCRRHPDRPASPGRSMPSSSFEEPRCFFQGLRDPRDHPGSPSSAIGASREVSAACNTYHRPVRALESS